MRLLALFTTAVAALTVDAASTLVIFYPFVGAPLSEVVAASSLGTTATVYERVCPTPTAVNGSSDCFKYSLTQGASTWEYNNSGPVGSVHATCTFTGGPIPAGTGSCTLTATGPASVIPTSTFTLTGSLFTAKGILETVTVLESTPSTATATATTTVSAVSTDIKTTGNHEQPSSSATHSSFSTGRAGSLAAPTGAVAAAVGGAAAMLFAVVGA